jgi:prevent-host-death family protein
MATDETTSIRSRFQKPRLIPLIDNRRLFPVLVDLILRHFESASFNFRLHPESIFACLTDHGIMHYGDKNLLTIWSDLTRLYILEVNEMYITNISEAKAQLSALVEKALAGQEVIIGKAGKPVAKLVQYRHQATAREPGALKGKIKIASDFDELPLDIAEALGMDK